MSEKKPWYKKWWIVVVIGIMLANMIAVPFIINWAYMAGKDLKEANTAYSASDLIIFYGSFLSFLGTVALGALALWQNKKANDTNEMIMEMTRREKMTYFYPTGLNAILDENPSINFINKGNSFGTINNIEIRINSRFHKKGAVGYFIDNNENRGIQVKLRKEDFQKDELNISFIFTWNNSFGFRYIQEMDLIFEKYNDPILKTDGFLFKNSLNRFKEYKEEVTND
ncbi:hypothetical protein CLNEO_09150 [Anaerotignum neopropionicum]|uniref:Uncharacterized protein n=1 Tax=Anaerotignum neopropionicum TaxID=36847 RepID=A0A136WH66_9FIRM|nr:hypothetical protein [Anaerotignum neopropionicum]KXL53689.1 hypothetical protein CLNEO_09150 [Anaerotignum neopropionicum]